MNGTIQCLFDLGYHVGHLILLGIQVQAFGQGLRFCDLAHTRVHLLVLDRNGPALESEGTQADEREQNIRVITNKENNISFIFVLFFNWQSKLN